MSAWRLALLRIAGFFGRDRGRSDRDLDDEMSFHLAMLEQRLRREGLSAADAGRAARAQFGGVVQVREAYRAQRSLPWIETIVQDLRYGVRTLARTPGVTAAALLTLALGIGATTAIFSVVNAVLLRPLPFASPERLVVFADSRTGDSQATVGTIGYATFDDMRRSSRTVQSMAAIRSWVPTLAGEGGAERVPALRVSWNFFTLLGVQPALGSAFTPEHDRPNDWHVVIISDGLWRRRFGSDPSVVGRNLRMNDVTFRIIGVMPPGFEPIVSSRFYEPAEMWAPLGYDTSLSYACRSCQHLRAVGRLAPGRSFDEAQAELASIRQGLADAHPGEYSDAVMTVHRLEDQVAGPIRPALYVLFGAVVFVLLIACANVANLLLARSMVRAREMALRGALGAGRARLVRQMLTESLALGTLGGVLGLGVAAVSLDWLSSMAPVSLPRADQVTLDGRVLAFALAASLATGLIFGLMPALRASSASLQPSLGGGARATRNRRGTAATRFLVIADLALALVLLAGSGLMLKSVARLLGVDPGFTPDRVVSLQLSLVGTAYREDPAVLSFINRAVAKVKALPGVEAAAMSGQIPLGGNRDSWGFHIEGRIAANAADDPSVERYSVTPDYFRVLRIPLVRGRLFDEGDRSESLPVIVLSESTARALWPGEDPIGQRVRIGGADRGPWRTVIGIAGDVRHTDLASEPPLQMYLPQSQVTDSFLVMTVRTVTTDPAAMVAQVRQVVREMDASVPIYSVATMDALVEKAAADRRFVMRLLGGFALLALLLAGMGLYGVISHSVTERTREVGVRVALGARRADILRLVLGAGARTVGAGLAAGVAAAFFATRFLEALLFGVGATDPSTFAGATAVLLAVALGAHLIPALRALRVDPVVALRQE